MKGTFPVVPTPFFDGKLDVSSLERLVAHTIDTVDGYVLCGSTGEAPSLTTEERIQIVREMTKIVGSEIERVVIGLGNTSLPDAIGVGRVAREMGVTVALVPSPYYFPNSLTMVIDYIGRLAEQTDLDILFYDNPYTTKTVFSVSDLCVLSAEIPRVIGIKMTDHNLDKVIQLKAQTNLKVFGGDDIICFRGFEAGVDGNMIIIPLIFPESFQNCWDLYDNGDRIQSFHIYSERLLPLIATMGPGDEIATSKALLHHMGIFTSAEVRTPLIASSARRIAEIRLAYEQCLNIVGH